jgi:hypothetical protein
MKGRPQMRDRQTTNTRRPWLATATISLALLTACSTDDAATSSDSTTVAATIDTAIAAELVDRWVGPPRTIGNLGTGTSAAFLDISDDFLMMETGISDNPKAFGSAISVESDDTVSLTLAGSLLECQDGATGRYTWKLSPQATTLTLTALDDACDSRRAAIEGEWTHTACRLAGRDCLGPVEAGTYSTNRWNPYGEFTYGQATFTLPDGWAVTYDSQAALFLGLASDYAANADPPPYGIRAWADVAPVMQTPSDCDDFARVDSTVAPGATAIADWMAALPTLTTTRSTMMLGDLKAEVVDADILDGQAVCGMGNLLVASRTSKPDPFAYGMTATQHIRVILVDVLPGRTVAMFIDDEARPGFDALAEVAMPIAESFRFSPVPPPTP